MTQPGSGTSQNHNHSAPKKKQKTKLDINTVLFEKETTFYVVLGMPRCSYTQYNAAVDLHIDRDYNHTP